MTADHLARASHLYEMLDNYYGTTRFSLQRAAELLTQSWSWFEHEIDAAVQGDERSRVISLWGLLAAQGIAMSPVLPDFSREILGHRTPCANPKWREIAVNPRPFRLN